jgi:hypothetical protein
MVGALFSTVGRTLAAVVTGAILATGCAARAPLAGPAARSEEQPAQRSFVLPVIEIVAMDGLINLAGRQRDPAAFEVTPASIRRNLRGSWVVDDDPFAINQFLHPYQGAMYHNMARSAGLSYWQSVAYTFAGSALWEIAGETTRPSKNDQIASGIGGSFLGEPLFLTSRLLIGRRDRGPGFWRALSAAVASPPAGFNRLVFGDRFDATGPEGIGASDMRVQLGVTSDVSGGLRPMSHAAMNTASIGVSVDYGFPGKAGYTYARPFDYFRVEATASSRDLEHLSTRGLLAGRRYGGANGKHGVVGVYGSYDYFAPDGFRVSSTAVSFGTTVQARTLASVTLQTTGLLGLGYTATRSIDASEGRTYHYGVAPQALASVRLVAGRRASLDVTAREYFVSDVAGFGASQRDVIFRGDAALALRVVGQHAVGVQYLFAERNARPSGVPQFNQTRATIGVFYTFLGPGGFGAIQ